MTITFRLTSWTLVLAALAASPAAAQAPASPKYVHFRWEKVADGIWFGITPASSFIGANTVIVSIPGGAFVVDPHITEFTANEIIAKAREVAGPVKYLVDTHLHNDHSQGNSAFKKAFPDVQIIAHRNTCAGIREKAVPRSRYRLGKLPRELEEMKANLAKVTDPALKASLERVIAGNELYVEDSRHLEWVFPDLCLDLAPGQSEDMRFGDREVQIRYFGKAHTAGDLVVFLPREKVIAIGDLFGATGTFFDFGRDGSGLEFPDTLRGISKLDYETVLPGHGEMFKGKAANLQAITAAQELVDKVKASYGQGRYIEQTLAEIPPPQRAASAPSGPTLATYVPYLSASPRAGWDRNLIRIYEELEMRKQQGMPVP
jgi:cyclase